MGKENKLFNLEFLAHDYQNIDEISLLSDEEIKVEFVDTSIKERSVSVNKICGIDISEIEEKFKQEARFEIIKELFAEIEEKEKKGEIYIGRSSIREEESIGVLMQEGIHRHSKLNGVVGALTVNVQLSDSWIKETVEEESEEKNNRGNNKKVKKYYLKYQIPAESIKKICEQYYRDDYKKNHSKVGSNKREYVNKYVEYIKISDKDEIILTENAAKELPSVFYRILLDNPIAQDKIVSANIRIESRFDYNKEYKSRSYFAAMLLSCGNIGHLNIDNVICDENNLFDCLLVALLSQNLEKAHFKGVYKAYRQFESNDEKVKGAIDVSRHIKLNAGMNNGRVACRYRENTINNYLNILICKAYDYAKVKYPEIVHNRIDNNSRLRSMLDLLRYEADAQSVSLQSVISNNLKPISHPYYNEYESVRKICLQLLRGEGVSIFEASDKTVNGFLYYLPDLWEDYLKNVFNQVVLKRNENGQYVYENLYLDEQAEEKYIIRDNSKSEVDLNEVDNKSDEKELYSCTARPDFVFKSKSVYNNVLILDAKMKPGAYRFFNNEYVEYRESLVNDVDKCLRDMVVYNAVLGTGVVFPKKVNDCCEKKDQENIDGNSLEESLTLEKRIECEYTTIPKDYFKRKISRWYTDKSFFVLPFVVPKSYEFDSYREWKKAFDYSEKTFIRYVMDEQVMMFLLPKEENKNHTDVLGEN